MPGEFQMPVYDVPPYRPLQTHMVASGRLKVAAYADTLPDGTEVLRALSDGSVAARRRKDGSWSRPVREHPEHPRSTDLIRASGPSVTVELVKGRYY